MSDQRVSIGIGAFAGLGNIALNAGVPTAQGVGLHTIDYAFMIAALVIITLLPLHPRWGALAYFFCWLLVLLLPGVYGSDVLLTNFAFFFFVGRFISVGYAVAILATTFAAHSALYLYVTDDASYEDFIGLVIYNLIALIFIPLGATVRASEQSRLDEARRAEERLEELRLEISREMHDLIAYSMSQTALRP